MAREVLPKIAEFREVSSLRGSSKPDKCEDPHVERLLEAFAFLAARVHLKIDDEFPEITEALLSVVYPHYIRPIPSMSIVELEVDPGQGKLTTGPQHRARLDALLASGRRRAVQVPHCYDTTSGRFDVSGGRLENAGPAAAPHRADSSYARCGWN
jgi:type VI secretion system protein ImpG